MKAISESSPQGTMAVLEACFIVITSPVPHCCHVRMKFQFGQMVYFWNISIKSASRH